MKELCVETTLSMSVFSDSKAAILAANPVYHERTKHIEIDCPFIREKINQGLVSTKYIATKDQTADMFTKALPGSQHEFLSCKLPNILFGVILFELWERQLQVCGVNLQTRKRCIMYIHSSYTVTKKGI